MTSRSGYARDRSRAKARREPEADAIAATLTAQIIICLLLLLSIWILKHANSEGYTQVKQEYKGLVGPESGDLSGYFSEVAGVGEGFFGKVEGLLRDLFGKDAAPRAEASAPESQAEFPVPESAEPSLPAYDYLEAQGSGQQEIPVQFAFQTLGAPANCTYSPVAVSARLRTPVAGTITSLFAYREHPISGKTDFHTGIDIAAAEGSRILAALPGEVVEVGEDDIYGKYIILRHATNLETFYAHCSEIIAREGMAVAQGERIAKVGMTGTATGYHLHFSVMVDGLFVDPLWVLSGNIVVVED